MTDIDKLAAALVAFQGEVPVIPKNRTAKIPTKTGSYSYQYADLSDMWDAIREPLRKNGLAVLQPLTHAAATNMAIKTIIVHESGQSLSETFEFTVAGRSPQEIGSLVTYMKRYALSAALGISTDDDDDGNTATHAPKPKAQTPEWKAFSELSSVVVMHNLDKAAVARRFTDDYGMDIRKADAATITAFTACLADDAKAGHIERCEATD